MPDDPFGDGPLLYRRTQEGVVIYSIGPNEVDDGGDMQARDNEPRRTLVSVHDPEHRGEPAAHVD